MQGNPDRRPLPPGCVTHFDVQRDRWYYVHLTNPPRVTFIHPADETPPNSQSPHGPRISTPQQQQPQSTTSFGQVMSNPSASPQRPSRFSPTFANPMPTPIVTPTAAQHQRQPSYGSGQSISPVQDYVGWQQNSSPTATVPLPRRYRPPSEAQSIYLSSLPQTTRTPSDNSHFSIYSSQEPDFDASSLYATSLTSVTYNSPSASSPPNLQPQRRYVTPLDGSNSSNTSPDRSSQHPRSYTMQAAPVAQTFHTHNVLRRKVKSSTILGNIPKPIQPAPKTRDVPTYSLVAQPPTNNVAKATTPAFQTLAYQNPPISSTLPGISNPNLGDPQQSLTQSQSFTQLTAFNQAPLGSTSMQGAFNSQFPSSMQANQPSSLTTSTGPQATAPTIPQQSMFPLQAQTTGQSFFSAPPMNTQALPSTMGLSNGVFSPSQAQATGQSVTNGTFSSAPSMNSQPPMHFHTQPTSSLIPTHPEPNGISNGTVAQPMASMSMPFNQPQSSMYTHRQSDSFSNGTMGPSAVPPPLTASSILLPPLPQQNNTFPNGMLQSNNMAQPTFLPQQPNTLPNGYAPGVPFGAPATYVQVGNPGQTPGVMAHPTVNNNTQQTPQAEAKDDKNKKLMKKAGMFVTKAAVKFGTKYVLEQMGVDDDVAGVAATVTAAGAEAAVNAATSSK